MGRDTINLYIVLDTILISIHSPRMGRDQAVAKAKEQQHAFQSTLPAWGETSHGNLGGELGIYFNPLSPHGERPALPAPFPPIFLFQSTLPAWGETREQVSPEWLAIISIHSPRMGRDIQAKTKNSRVTISIHSPRMGRDLTWR